MFFRVSVERNHQELNGFVIHFSSRIGIHLDNSSSIYQSGFNTNIDSVPGAVVVAVTVACVDDILDFDIGREGEREVGIFRYMMH